jgi:hypothetical protein
LIFFTAALIESCATTTGQDVIVRFTDSRATSVVLSKKLFEKASTVHYEDTRLKLFDNSEFVLGDVKLENDEVIFTPVVPLTPGSKYEIVNADQVVKVFDVEFPKNLPEPEILGVYPDTDTLPANLLKLYLKFSVPMREGEALKHVLLTNETGDTLDGTFLDLQPELWDSTRSTLTLWLDPGRIKRELIPNQKSGNPLEAGKTYTIHITGNWKSAAGLPISENFSRKFTAAGRDSLLPLPDDWHILTPPPLTTGKLRINFPEPMDYYLVQKSISFYDPGGRRVRGRVSVLNHGSSIDFFPAEKWESGIYLMRAASNLEDLAGNNLIRPFDRDLLTDSAKMFKPYLDRSFIIGSQGRGK